MEGWFKDNYYRRSDEICGRILWGEDDQFKDTIERISVEDLSVEEFLEKYENGSKPVII